MVRICFVCLGNICRSPMAEFVMKDLAEKAGHSLVIESRATSDWEHGNPIHQGTQAILRQKGIAYSQSKRSQVVSQADLEEFDVIVGMDDSNVKNLKKLSNGRCDHKIRLLLDVSVPDPWYTGDFEETYDLVRRGCQQLLLEIEKGRL